MNLRHIILITFRSLKRAKIIFFINLVGLSAGLAGAFFIYLWVQDEWRKDKFHKNGEELYQVLHNFENTQGKITTVEWTPAFLANALVKDMPEVTSAVTVSANEDGEQSIVSAKNKAFKITGKYCGADFFKVFSFKVLTGNQAQFFEGKKNVMISDELARKLFKSTQNALNQQIQWNKDGTTQALLVKGVFEKPSSSSSMQFDMLLNTRLFYALNPAVKKWSYNGPGTYIVLKKGTSPALLNKKLKNYLQQKGVKGKQFLFVAPYIHRYLFGKYSNGVQTGGRITYVRLFSLLAILILVIACINFMNLSTAQASRRMKEIGVKKVVGVNRKTLIIQFLGESVAITTLAMLLAITSVELLLPQFNMLTSKTLVLRFDMQFLLTVLGLTLFTGLLAGSYPALYLSGFNPIKILKGNIRSPKQEMFIRKGLVIFQFAVSVVMIVSTLVVYQQIAYIQSQPLGYERSQVILFKRDGKLQEGFESFVSQVKSIPGVVNASSFSNNFYSNETGTKRLTWEGQGDREVAFKYLSFNYNLIETLGMQMKEGRSFSRKFGNDQSKIIFNEAAIKAMGLKDPVGKTVTLWHKKRQIIGVVKNFHFESLYEELKPCFIQLRPNGDNIAVKIHAKNTTHTLAQIRKKYAEFNPGLHFEYNFLDQVYQRFYRAEKRVSIISQYFAGFAILISCLGLFGLATFTLEKRMKEIGIRKVLGSSNLNIIYLLSGSYTKMVLTSLMIGIPMSIFLLQHWLSNFTYHIELTFGYFLIAGALIMFVALFTVSLQTIKAARINPVKCLKDE